MIALFSCCCVPNLIQSRRINRGYDRTITSTYRDFNYYGNQEELPLPIVYDMDWQSTLNYYNSTSLSIEQLFSLYGDSIYSDSGAIVSSQPSSYGTFRVNQRDCDYNTCTYDKVDYLCVIFSVVRVICA